MKKRLYAIFVTLLALTMLLALAVAADDEDSTVSYRVIVDPSVTEPIDITVNSTGDSSYSYTITYGSVASSRTLTFDENYEATVRMTGGSTLEGDFPAGTFFMPPEGFAYSSKTDENGVTVCTIKSDVQEINGFAESGSGEGWSWSDDGKTLTIEENYILSGKDIKNCEKLILNGKIQDCVFINLKELTGNGAIENCIFGQKVNDEAKEVTLTSDKPFSLAYKDATLESAAGIPLTFYFIGSSNTPETQIILNIESGFDHGESEESSGITIKNKMLILDPDENEYKCSFKSFDTDWLANKTITNVSQLKDLAYCVNIKNNSFSGETITLAANLRIGKDFTPIGLENSSFKGTFDGNGHTITFDHDPDNSTEIKGDFALFNYTFQATIKNLKLSGNINIKGNSDYYASLITHANKTTVLNCASDVSIRIDSENAALGGLITSATNSSILNSCFYGELYLTNLSDIASTQNRQVGGLIHYVVDSEVKNCYASVVPKGNNNSNNFIYSSQYTIFENCYAESSVPVQGDVTFIPHDSFFEEDFLLTLNDNAKDSEEMSFWSKSEKDYPIPFEFKPSIKIAADSPTQTTTITIIKSEKDNTPDIFYEFDVTGVFCIDRDYGWINRDLTDNTLTIKPSEIKESDFTNGKCTLKLFAISNFFSDKKYDDSDDEAKLAIEVILKEPCDHSFQWVIDKEPSYTATGIKHEECTKCHETRNENTTIDKLEREDPPMIIMNAYIYFETNGGEKLDTVKTIFGMNVDLMKYIPERAGYEFDGWYKDAELTEFVSSIRVVGTTTVYAKWIREELPFNDIDRDSNYYDDIGFVYDEGLMIGTSDDEFSPDLTLTRGMVTTILWRMSGSPVVNYLMLYKDVDEEAYYAEAVRWASAEKIVNGIGDDLFAPDAEVTREQLATIIYRYVQKNGGGFKGMWYFPLRYNDAADISDYADEAMHWCVMNGIIESDEDNNLRPTAPATRAETAHAYHILSMVNS